MRVYAIVREREGGREGQYSKKIKRKKVTIIIYKLRVCVYTSIVYPLPGFLLPIHVRSAVYIRIGRRVRGAAARQTLLGVR